MPDSPEAWIERLRLRPLPVEGGYYRETCRAAETLGPRNLYTAIYYLLLPDTFSALHRLACDEIYSFVAGDPVSMLLLGDGSGREVRLGNTGAEDVEPQLLVPRGVWQGSRLEARGRYALMTTVCVPGYDQEDFELGPRGELVAAYPAFRERIESLTNA